MRVSPSGHLLCGDAFTNFCGFCDEEYMLEHVWHSPAKMLHHADSLRMLLDRTSAKLPEVNMTLVIFTSEIVP